MEKNAKIWEQIFLILPTMLYFGIFGLEFKKKLLSYLKSGPSNISICKFAKNAKMLKCVTKNGRFRYFRTRIWKQYSHIWNPLPRICVIAKFCRKAKMPKLTTKNAIFGYFWPKMSYFDFKNVIFEIRTLKYIYFQICQKSKDAKMCYQKWQI